MGAGMRRRRRTGEAMRIFYDWFYRYYGLVENNIVPTLKKLLGLIDPSSQRFINDSFLELACGSAGLGLLMAPRVRIYEGRDQSEKMLERARMRWRTELDPSVRDRYPSSPFFPGNLMEIGEIGSPDWIGISFALHLFSPEDELRILDVLFKASVKGVIVFDHEQRWSPMASFIEWLEGSWYEQFIKVDFAFAAERMGARFASRVISGCQVMEFLK